MLTYNAPRALERCLRAISAQEVRPQRVLVVDNDGEVRAADTLAGVDLPGAEVLRLADNTGPAGGHAAGLQTFLDSGLPHAWVMDDDCVPAPDALRLLREAVAQHEGPVLAFPTWVDEPSGEVVDWPAWCGFLIDRAVVADVGLPRADFFWWAEDTEYLHFRIPAAGHTVIRVPGAQVVHGRNRAGRYRPPWKVYYEVRNSVYYRLYVQRRRGRRFYRLFRTMVRMLARILLREDRRAVKLVMYARGVVDGLTGRLGKRVPVQIREIVPPAAATPSHDGGRGDRA